MCHTAHEGYGEIDCEVVVRKIHLIPAFSASESSVISAARTKS